MRLLVASLLLTALCLDSATSRADVPPRDGASSEKHVRYTFTVHSTPDGADPMFFAYPCSGTDRVGRDANPTDKVTLLGQGTSVGMGQGETCSIYMIKKADYDHWQQVWGPSSLSTLAAAATKCTGGPSPLTTVSSDDSRDSINEDLDVKGGASACDVTSRGAPKASEGGGCSVSGTSESVPLALLLGLPAAMLLLGRRRRTT